MYVAPGALLECNQDFGDFWLTVVDALVRKNNDLNLLIPPSDLPLSDSSRQMFCQILRGYALHVVFTLDKETCQFVKNINDVNKVFRMRLVVAFEEAVADVLLTI